MEKKILEELLENLHKRKSELEHCINAESREIAELKSLEVNDEGDYAEVSNDAFIDGQLIAQQSKELEEIQWSMTKINNGDYGICEMCDEVIPVNRLRVKPFARYCIKCREIHEKTHNTTHSVGI